VAASSQNYGTVISRMVWSLLTPFFSILNYIRNLVFGGGGGSAAVSGSGSGSGGGRNTQHSSLSNAASTQNPT
jgi:hypothetical protein